MSIFRKDPKAILCPNCHHYHDGTAEARVYASVGPYGHVRVPGFECWCSSCLGAQQDYFNAYVWARHHRHELIEAHKAWRLAKQGAAEGCLGGFYGQCAAESDDRVPFGKGMNHGKKHNKKKSR